MADEFVICRHPGPAKNDKPCVRERGHEDEHWFWHQSSKRSVWVFTAEGEQVMHLGVTAWLSEDEVAVLVEYMSWTRKKLKEGD